MTAAAIWPLDPARYEPHALHRGARIFLETNCYVDLWIELLHTLDLDPTACFAFPLSTGFEGDQWTFFKPPPGDLFDLYGLDVQEINVYRPLRDHVLVQVAQGRPVLVEVDAFHLPDTAGTSYRREHAKTTIAVQSIDLSEGALGYFHNAGYFALSGDDFAHVLPPDRGSAMAPYVEVVKSETHVRHAPRDLAERALACARAHLARRPAHNPIARFAPRFDEALGELLGDLAGFHLYAFATLRQLGASAELAAAFARWLEREAHAPASCAAARFDEVASGARVLLFKAARAVNARRRFDAGEVIEAMAASWEAAIAAIEGAIGAGSAEHGGWRAYDR